ncbi:CPBP family intramembrane metalloprotease [Candidatus Saccharibacteria bacterium]|nr:CPBP family intramembrane metalloprotease [Candidatus Saccharibacteria bacterium]
MFLMAKTKNIATTLVIYYVVLFTVWLCVEWVFHLKFISTSDPENYWLIQSGIKEGVLKIVIWLIPAILLIRAYKSRLYLSLEEMFRNRVNWLKLLPVLLLFTIYLVLGVYDIFDGTISIVPGFVWSQLLWVLFVGITEEMVFRGWLLNATIKDASKRKQWAMVAINSLLFLGIHVPIWIFTNQLDIVFSSFSFLSVIALSFIFSWTFIKTKSIVPAIILHMYWDLLMVLFYGA